LKTHSLKPSSERAYNAFEEELPMERGTIACQKCGRKRRSRVCPHCGWDACYIKIGFDGERYRFFEDEHGNPYTFSKALETQLKINNQIKDHEFYPKDYDRRTIDERVFENAFERFLDEKEKEYAPSNKYRTYYNNYLHFFDGLDIRDINTRKLHDFYKKHLPRRHSSKYRNNIMSCVFAFLRWLKKFGELKNLPVFPQLDPDDCTPRDVPEYHEQQIALDNFPEIHRDIEEFLMETGMRPGEACTLKIKDINWVQGKMLVRRTLSACQPREKTKGRHKTLRTLSTRAYEIARENSLGRDPEEYIFINPITGRAYKTEFLRKQWKRFAGIPYQNYSNRHALATRLVEQGAGELEVMKIMGHADIRSTQSYFAPTADRQRDLLDNRNKVVDIKTHKKRGR
jgi:integrase